jgi:hypothetical protein
MNDASLATIVVEDPTHVAAWRAWQLRNRVREEALNRKMTMFFALLPPLVALVWFASKV